MTTLNRLHETPTTGTQGKISFDDLNGFVSVTRWYDVDADPESCVGALGSVPKTFNVSIDGTTVPCRLVQREASRIGTGRSRLALTYEGHQIGVMYWTGKTQGQSERLMLSLDTPPQQLDRDNQGVMRIVPISTLQVHGNETVSTVEDDDGLWDKSLWLVGAVNEANWQPIYRANTDPKFFNEGYYLFTSAEFVRNRDWTYTYHYTFEHSHVILNGVYYPMHQAPWANIERQIDTTVTPNRLMVSVIGAVKTPRRYPTAGTAATQNWKFDDLGF